MRRKRTAESRLYQNNNASKEKQYVSLMNILACDNRANNLQLNTHIQALNDVWLALSQTAQYIAHYLIGRSKIDKK